jgi:hypothetical protein
VADEATVVGIARGYWAAACSRCDWIYKGQCREVDAAARSHCGGCGGDVVAMTNPGRDVTLRLERNVQGHVVPGSPTTELNAEPELISTEQAMREYGEQLSRPGYWSAANLSGFEGD